ncbi:MAG: dihydrofolate reductase [Bacteroidetes bacterium]|nr:dihydrofolate reductase [Bacteroidota bacterium]
MIKISPSPISPSVHASGVSEEPGTSAGSPTIALVAAVARNGVIGNGGRMPWHLPDDLRHFKRITLGKPVIMGRKTFESLGKPLPERTNIVLTRDPAWQAPGVCVVTSFDDALAAGRAALTRHPPKAHQIHNEIPVFSDIMVIGGAEIYALALPRAQRLYLTDIPLTPAGETVFPAFDPAAWREVYAQPGHPTVPGDPVHTFRLLESCSQT